MLYTIIIFVLYSMKIVNCESYNNKYSGYSGNYYSQAFNSGYSGNYYSQAFNSGYSNVFNSIVFNSNIFSYTKSSNKNYLTFYNSYDLKNSNTHYSFLSKSTKQIISINSYLSLINSYTFPISKPYSNIISYSKPTLLPTLEPEKFIPVLSFETSMTLSGLTEPSLDTNAQSAVLIALASSINISTNYVLFLGQEVVARRKLMINHLLSTYNIKAITQINIPLTNQYSNINPSILYTSLTTNLTNSINNGNFITFLISASIALNSTSTQNVIVTNYSVSQMVLTNNNSFTFAPSLAPSLTPSLTPSYNTLITGPSKDFNVKELFTIVFTCMGCFILLLAIYYYVKIRINKKESFLSIQPLSIQPLSIQSLSIQPLSNEPLSIQPFLLIQEEPPVSIQEQDIILSINE